MADPDEIALELERLAAKDKASHELDQVLAPISNEDTLWSVAERVPLSIAAAGALYRRAQEIGGSWDTARGYLALAHLFEGDPESATGLVGEGMPSTRDPILLDAWTALAEDSSERVARLGKALERVPDSLRLWRALASEALRVEDWQSARAAHEWLAVHETNVKEVERVRAILRQHGWA
jgi:hypothetical protein